MPQPPIAPTPDALPVDAPLSVRLREGTAPAHRRLDQQPALARLAAPGLTTARYLDSLLALRRAWVPLERWLEQALEADRDDARAFFLPRRQALLADIDALAAAGASPPEDDTVPLPTGLEAGSPAHRIGCLYVLTGAQMGAVLLERSVAAALPGAPLGFLTTRFDDAGPRWLRFRQFLDHRFPGASDQTAAIAAANRTFDLFLSSVAAVTPSTAAAAPESPPSGN